MSSVSDYKLELSKKILSVTPSVTLAITAKAKELSAQGVDIIALSAGEPDFDTPQQIKQAAISALESGATKYTPAIGTVEFREAIAAKLKRDQGLDFPVNQIIVSTGAKHSLFNIFFALLNDGDEVLIPAPYWLSYPEMVTLSGGTSIFLDTTEETGFKITPDILKSKLTDKTKVLVLNSPSNPTGAVYTEAELKALIEVIKQFPRLTVVSDEIYERLMYDGAKHISIASLDPEIAKRTVIVNGHSKAYSMTGWRLGYAACPNAELAKAITSLQSHSTSNPTAFAQAGGVEALKSGDVDAARMLEVFAKRRDSFYAKIAAIDKLVPFKPQGAFYLFVNIAATGLDSMTFVARALEEAHVAVVPGKPFGIDTHVRMSFATSDELLDEAARRLGEWIHKL